MILFLHELWIVDGAAQMFYTEKNIYIKNKNKTFSTTKANRKRISLTTKKHGHYHNLHQVGKEYAKNIPDVGLTEAHSTFKAKFHFISLFLSIEVVEPLFGFVLCGKMCSFTLRI